MATAYAPSAVAQSMGLDALAVQVDMGNAHVAVDRFDAALAGLLMTDLGSVFSLYVAFSVRAEQAKDAQLKALYEPVAARYLQRFQQLVAGRKVDHIFQQPIEQLKKKFLAIYPLGKL